MSKFLKQTFPFITKYTPDRVKYKMMKGSSLKIITEDILNSYFVLPNNMIKECEVDAILAFHKNNTHTPWVRVDEPTSTQYSFGTTSGHKLYVVGKLKNLRKSKDNKLLLFDVFIKKSVWRTKIRKWQFIRAKALVAKFANAASKVALRSLELYEGGV